jgi:uncharacterized protein (DUF2252 family)
MIRNTRMKDRAEGSTLIDEIIEFNRDRIPRLVRIKYERMAQDAFCFFRGSDHLFASRWERLRPPDVGPSILICGDLHLENVGAYRTDDGEFLYDLNDFDEALVGPCSLDVVRCTTSILLAAQLWKFTPVQAMRTVLTYLDRYRLTVTRSLTTGHVGAVSLGTGRGPIWRLLGKAARGNQGEFLARLVTGAGPGSRRIIRKADRFRSVGSKWHGRVSEAVERYGEARDRAEEFKVLDVASRVAGIGSLGLRRFVVLVEGSGTPAGNRILDIKEVRSPSLLGCVDAGQPGGAGNEAIRTVEAQRWLQSRPAVGLGVIELDGQMYRMRELIPDENRGSLDHLRKRPGTLRRAVATTGRLTGWAQVRGCRYRGEDRADELARWVAGPGLDAVIASAVRYADQTRQDYRVFRDATMKRLMGGG